MKKYQKPICEIVSLDMPYGIMYESLTIYNRGQGTLDNPDLSITSSEEILIPRNYLWDEDTEEQWWDMWVLGVCIMLLSFIAHSVNVSRRGHASSEEKKRCTIVLFMGALLVLVDVMIMIMK